MVVGRWTSNRTRRLRASGIPAALAIGARSGSIGRQRQQQQRQQRRQQEVVADENMPLPRGGGGVEYSLKDGGRGADDQGNSWFLDAVPQDSNLGGIPLRLLRMCDLKDAEEKECPITGELFDAPSSSVGSSTLPESTTLLNGEHSDRCIVVTPCGHMFGGVAFLYHALVRDMRCPMCRAGPKSRLRLSSIPMHLRTYIGDAARRAIADEQRENEEANDREVMSIVLNAMGVVGFPGSAQQIFEVTDSSSSRAGTTTATRMIRITTFVYASSSSSRDGGSILLSILNLDMEVNNSTTSATLSEDSVREFRAAFQSGHETGVRFVIYELQGGNGVAGTRRIGQTGTLSSEDLHGALHATDENDESNTGIVRLMCLDESRGSLILRGNIELYVGRSSSSSSGMARSTRGSRLNRERHSPFSSGEGSSSSMSMDYITQLRWVPRGST